jgi:pSer/pThr/pTyr-binding forkhead associated (FHA) protein
MFAIEDLGSRNGTFVNGDRVTEKRPLADGDVVRFGKVLLTFNMAIETRAKDSTQPEVELPRRPAKP